MQGFLARAGHALGRLIVFFGYGGLGGNQVDAACIETAIALSPGLTCVVSVADEGSLVNFSTLVSTLLLPTFETGVAAPLLAAVVVTSDTITPVRIPVPTIASELSVPSLASDLWITGFATRIGTTLLSTALPNVTLATKVEGDC